MTEHLIMDARESTETASGEIYLLQSPKLDRTEASLDLGFQAVGILNSLDLTGSTEHLSTLDNPVLTGGTENMVNNQEGIQNAELFKRMYDAAVQSIDDALEADTDELHSKIPAILSAIDALHATPYISSAPEFVALVKAAKSSIEATNSFTALNGEGTNLAIPRVLSLAKQQLAGTLIAYRPQQ